MKQLIIATTMVLIAAGAWAQRRLDTTAFVQVKDIGKLFMTIKRPGTDSVFGITALNGDTTWRFRYVDNSSAGGGVTDWPEITNKPSAFTPTIHGHNITDVTGLQTALDGKQASGSYAASVHTHGIADVTNLQSSLDAKAATVHGHIIADVTSLQSTLDAKAATSHAHVIADVTGLQTALDGKQASGSYAATIHTHAIADVTNLQTSLDAKQDNLVSGTTIKTINGTSILGSGDIVISGGSGYNPATGPIFFTDFITAATTASPPFVGAAISTGTNAVNTANLNGNRPGVVRMTSSTTANGGYRWQTDLTTIRLKGNEVFECAIAPVNFTTTTMRCGFLDNTTSADAVDGAYFEYTTSGNIVFKTSSNSVRTTSATITTLSLNTWYKLRITVNSNATSITAEVFDANGTLINSVTNTTNIPTAAGRECGTGIICTESTTTATAMCDLDYLKTTLTLTR